MSSSISLEPKDLPELSDRDKLVIGAAYTQLFTIHGEIPPVEKVYTFLEGIYSIPVISEFAASEEFQTKLVRQGLKVDSPVGGLLSPEQILWANLAMNPHDRRSVRQKLQMLDESGVAKITVNQINAWERDPAYQEYVTAISKKVFEGLEEKAMNVIARAVNADDLNAAKLVLEMKGKLVKKLDINVSTETVVVKLIEIIVAHVDDKEIIDAISHDIAELDL